MWGTFKSSRRGKRKRGGERPNETYTERQQRRIKKKFGVNGVALGEDEATKVKLENGKKPKGKPRVAGSKRGRVLRAAAALARFDQTKDEELKKEAEEVFGDSETEDDSDDSGVKTEAFDLDGSQLKDGEGRDMVRVCGDEDQEDIQVKQEMDELLELDGLEPRDLTEKPNKGRRGTRVDGETPAINQTESHSRRISAAATPETSRPATKSSESRLRMEDIPLYVDPDNDQISENRHSENGPVGSGGQGVQINITKASHTARIPVATTASQLPDPPNDLASPTPATELICPICSMANESSSLLCLACSHVLDIRKITKYWRCQSETCKSSQYINAADQGLCGICGARRNGDESGRVNDALNPTRGAFDAT